MRALYLVPVLAGVSLIGSGCLSEEPDTSTEALASETDDGHGDHNCPGPAPIMQVGDFNGDGIVDSADVDALSQFKDSGRYAAFWDMDADGDLDGQDVSIVSHNIGKAGTARDAQMAELWRTTYPYKYGIPEYGLSGIEVAVGIGGYQPWTPDLMGHGIHFANFDLVYSWFDRGFQAGQPEGLNYTAQGDLVAAFYYAPAAVDLANMGAEVPAWNFYHGLSIPPSFDGIMTHEWHNHVGPCFGGATEPVPGFDQCMTYDDCMATGAALWSPKFYMLHVWLYEHNECGPFGGIDTDVSPDAPMEPNHNACTVEEVTCIVMYDADGNMMVDEHGHPMCKSADDDGHDGH